MLFWGTEQNWFALEIRPLPGELLKLCSSVYSFTDHVAGITNVFLYHIFHVMSLDEPGGCEAMFEAIFFFFIAWGSPRSQAPILNAAFS